MPLHVQFVRDGNPIAMPYGFGAWHLGCAYDVASIEGARALGLTEAQITWYLALPTLREADDDQIKCIHQFMDIGHDHRSKVGDVTVTEKITFHDPSDGEVLELLPGDKIRMWR